MINGFGFNGNLEDIGKKAAEMEIMLDFAERLIRLDDDGTEMTELQRDGIRHLFRDNGENVLLLEFLKDKLDNMLFRMIQMRRRNEWVAEDLEEPEARVGALVAEEPEEGETEEAFQARRRKEIQDGLADTH